MKRFSLAARVNSFRYAFQGLAYLFQNEHNTWIHFLLAIIAVVMGFVLKITKTEWIMISLAIGMVLAAEAFNTAIEVLTDLVSPEIHPKAKAVKDVSAAAVLITAITAAIIGLEVFLPYIAKTVS